jgi:hypothetical protein
VENVIDAIKVARFFDCGDVCRLLDYANNFLIARRAAAVNAGIDVGNVVADRAQMKVGFNVADSGGEGVGIVRTGAQNMKGETLGALAADSRQFLEFVDEPGHGLGKFRHRKSIG